MTERSDDGAVLHWVSAPRGADRVVLLLHGQADRGAEPPSRLAPVVLRMVPFAWALRRKGGSRVAVAFLRYGGSGWQGGARVGDGRWALQQVSARYPGLPIGLLGHSMGGRVALRLTGAARVDRVVTLATWAEHADVPHWRVASGTRMWFVHGLDDRVTSPDGSREAATRFEALGAQVRLDLVQGETHAMLRQASRWHREVARVHTEPEGG